MLSKREADNKSTSLSSQCFSEMERTFCSCGALNYNILYIPSALQAHKLQRKILYCITTPGSGKCFSFCGLKERWCFNLLGMRV